MPALNGQLLAARAEQLQYSLTGLTVPPVHGWWVVSTACRAVLFKASRDGRSLEPHKHVTGRGRRAPSSKVRDKGAPRRPTPGIVNWFQTTRRKGPRSRRCAVFPQIRTQCSIATIVYFSRRTLCDKLRLRFEGARKPEANLPMRHPKVEVKFPETVNLSRSGKDAPTLPALIRRDVGDCFIRT